RCRPERETTEAPRHGERISVPAPCLRASVVSRSARGSRGGDGEHELFAVDDELAALALERNGDAGSERLALEDLARGLGDAADPLAPVDGDTDAVREAEVQLLPDPLHA